MSTKSRLDKLYRTAPRIGLPEDARILFISDTHWGRGKDDKADDFYQRRNILYALLSWAWDNGYIVIIVGDWLELYENDNQEEVLIAYPALWGLIQQFKTANRLYIIEGNHDKGLGYPEAYLLVLDDDNYFVIHGHQTDFWNSGFMWYFSKWVVRHIWRGLQYLGWRDVQASDEKRHAISEHLLMEWANENKVKTISGHTHNPCKDGFYLNDGAFVGKEYAYIRYDKQNGMVLSVDKLPC